MLIDVKPRLNLYHEIWEIQPALFGWAYGGEIENSLLAYFLKEIVSAN